VALQSSEEAIRGLSMFKATSDRSSFLITPSTQSAGLDAYTTDELKRMYQLRKVIDGVAT
jgi:hypothetical protein